MVARRATINRKGQVTIPIEIRRSLNLRAGDPVAVEQQGDTIRLRRAGSVAERTSGIFAKYRKTTPLSPAEERALFEQGVADEVVSADN